MEMCEALANRDDRRVPYAGIDRIRFKGISDHVGISAVLKQHP